MYNDQKNPGLFQSEAASLSDFHHELQGKLAKPIPLSPAAAASSRPTLPPTSQPFRPTSLQSLLYRHHHPYFHSSKWLLHISFQRNQIKIIKLVSNKIIIIIKLEVILE